MKPGRTQESVVSQDKRAPARHTLERSIQPRLGFVVSAVSQTLSLSTGHPCSSPVYMVPCL
jgi:hypothetical protein